MVNTGDADAAGVYYLQRELHNGRNYWKRRDGGVLCAERGTWDFKEGLTEKGSLAYIKYKDEAADPTKAVGDWQVPGSGADSQWVKRPDMSATKKDIPTNQVVVAQEFITSSWGTKVTIPQTIKGVVAFINDKEALIDFAGALGPQWISKASFAKLRVKTLNVDTQQETSATAKSEYDDARPWEFDLEVLDAGAATGIYLYFGKEVKANTRYGYSNDEPQDKDGHSQWARVGDLGNIYLDTLDSNSHTIEWSKRYWSIWEQAPFRGLLYYSFDQGLHPPCSGWRPTSETSKRRQNIETKIRNIMDPLGSVGNSDDERATGGDLGSLQAELRALKRDALQAASQLPTVIRHRAGVLVRRMRLVFLKLHSIGCDRQTSSNW